MNIQQSKTSCLVRFAVDGEPELRSSPFAAVFHLFEHQYDDETFFWYGVIDVACNLDDFRQHRQCDPPGLFHLDIELPDGRLGGCRMLQCHGDSDWQSEHSRFAVVGDTALKVPR